MALTAGPRIHRQPLISTATGCEKGGNQCTGKLIFYGATHAASLCRHID